MKKPSKETLVMIVCAAAYIIALCILKHYYPGQWIHVTNTEIESTDWILWYMLFTQ